MERLGHFIFQCLHQPKLMSFAEFLAVNLNPQRPPQHQSRASTPRLNRAGNACPGDGMTTTPLVLHRTARPISPYEFLDAVRATCAPRFPYARCHDHRPIGNSSLFLLFFFIFIFAQFCLLSNQLNG